jgi:crotonobetainyl-CoA:carnitine CoA-transferase CaiB-like acyl-CoA transferase
MKKEEFYREALINSKGPLEGIRVLEATNYAAGPIAGMVLADLGAENIKCDIPKSGDPIRQLPPFVPGEPLIESSVWHLTLNRNKKGITLNLRSTEGQEIFKQLAAKSDIVIQNFQPGTMANWGLGYEEIKKVKEDIIYVSISGFGQYGPYSMRLGYDHVGQAMGGIMSVTGQPDSPPTRVGPAIADNMTGWQGAIAALAALQYRNKTGRGQQVEACLTDSILYASDVGIMGTANADYHWARRGNTSDIVAPFNVYPCQDGYIYIGLVIDAHWGKLCQVIGREDLIIDSRTNTRLARRENREFIDGIITIWSQDKTVAQAMEALDEAEIPASPVLGFPEIIRDRHYREREMVTEVEHPLKGRLSLYGVPTKYSLSPAKIRMHAPTLGQHNNEIYGQLLGLSPETIQELERKGVI